MASTAIYTSATTYSSAAIEGQALIGRTVKDRYRLVDVIGEGGMGAVYAAEHVAIGRRVAVKLVHAVHARNPQIVGRLKQEARATAAIESEHVVQVIDAGEDESLGLFVVMEMLVGEDLETRLQRERRLPEPDAIRIADQAARGLGRAHARGVIHRDLKPANVFLAVREDSNDPLVKLVDFGIAKLVHDATVGQQHHGLTQSGCVVGTAQYMSPEQAQGLDTIDGRTDVYSLGALMYEMIVGEPPVPQLANYEQKILHIVTKHRPRISESVPTVSPELDQLVSEMLATEPDERPRDMKTVRERLAALTPGARVTISTPPLPPAVYDSFPPLSVTAVDLMPVDLPVNALFGAWSDARRLAWGGAVIVAFAVAIIGVRTATGASESDEQPVVQRTVEKPILLVATGIEAKAPRPRAPAAPPRQWVIPQWTPPPAAPSSTSRPLGGTGISQEF